MSFGKGKRFSPKRRAKDLELLQEHEEQHSQRLMTRRQRHTPDATNRPSGRGTDFHVKPVTPPMIEKKSDGKIDLDLKKVNKAAKLLSESPDAHKINNLIRSRSNLFGSSSFVPFTMQRHNTFPLDSHKRLEREERQYRRRLELLQSQSMEKASEVSRLQTAIKELQTEVETTNQDSIRHERDSDQLTTSVGEITRVVESSETAIAESNEQVASLHEIFEGMLERADATEQTYTRAKLQQEDLGTAKEKMLAQQEIKTRQVQQLGKTVSDLQSRMHDLTLQLSEESSIVDQNRSENRALKETYRKLEKLVARSNRKLLSEDTDGSRLTEVSGNTTRSTSSDWWPSGSTASLGGSDHVGSFSRTVAAHSPGASVELDDEMCMTMSPSNGVQHSVTSPDKHPGGAATSDVESESSDADAEPEPKSTSPNTATASALSASNVHTSSAKSISPTSNDGTAGGTKIRWKLGDEKLGEGAFAQVYMGLELDTGHIIAVKELKVRFDCEPAKEHLQALEKEIGVMRNLHHPNIVRYIGTERSNSRLFILLEYVSGGSISTMLKRFGALGEDTVRVYCRHILEGLGYLHDRHIVHRDIKGANLLVGEDGFVKLADFGCSIQLESLTSLSMNEGTKLEASGHTKAFVMNGSVPWMAPEVMKQENPGQKADIWSLGCTVVEMLTGHRPWPAYKTHMSLILKLMTKPGRPPLTGMKATLSATADAFLGSCFQVDPRVRWTAKQLSHHAYVSGGVRA